MDIRGQVMLQLCPHLPTVVTPRSAKSSSPKPGHRRPWSFTFSSCLKEAAPKTEMVLCDLRDVCHNKLAFVLKNPTNK